MRDPFSRTLWGIDWRALLPLALGDDISVAYGDFESVSGFVARHYAEIFETSEFSVFTGGKMTASRARYYRNIADFFEFRRAGRSIGVLVCTPVDWSTYYLRSGALLPEYQDRKLMQRFVPFLFEQLARAGVERVQTDTSPSNLRMMQLLTHLHFNVTGTTLTERWGAHVHFTKFLDADSEGVFLEQFCSGVQYQIKQRRVEPGSG